MHAKQHRYLGSAVGWFVCTAVVIGALAGCASTTPVLDSKFKEASDSSKSAQRVVKQYPVKGPLPQAAELQPAFASYLSGGSGTSKSSSASSSLVSSSQGRGSQTGAQ